MSLSKSKYRKKYYQEHREAERAQQREYYLRNRDRLLEHKRQWRRQNREKQRAYAERDREKKKDYYKAWKREYRKKHRKEHAAGLQAWRKVPLTQKCERCGSTEYLQRHHPDYSKPLDVVVLCQSCHQLVHANVGG